MGGQQSQQSRQQSAALCITGQIRAAPVAHSNWAAGPLYELLGTATPDLYVVASMSNSFYYWQRWLTINLRPVSTFVYQPGFDFWNASGDWTHRASRNGTRLQINARTFPALWRTTKAESALIQMVQSWHCGRIIRDGEKALGKRYERVARIRSDVVVGVMHWATRYQPWVRTDQQVLDATRHRIAKGATCVAMRLGGMGALARAEEATLRECHAQIAGSPQHWFIFGEFHAVGVRDVMLDVVFKAVDAVAAGEREFQRSLPDCFHFAQAVYDWIARRTFDAKPTPPEWFALRPMVGSPLPACSKAIGDFDIVRAFGPPVASYYLQESEGQCSVKGTCKGFHEVCPARCVDEACTDFMHRRWGLQRVGSHGLHYVSKARTIERGVRLVGDFPNNHKVYQLDIAYDGFVPSPSPAPSAGLPRRLAAATDTVFTPELLLARSSAILGAADLAAFRSAVRAAVRLPSGCVPSSSVLVSVVGAAATMLRPLQFERVASLHCLMRRVVTLCWNHTDAFGACVPARPLSTPPSAAAREVQYHALTWAKWHVLHAALLEARVALFVDADVLLLANPFTTLSVSRFAAEHADKHADERHEPTPELLYQFEGPGSNPINGGQLLASSSHEAEAVRVVLSQEPTSFGGVTQLDQEIAYLALSGRPEVRTAELPHTFAGNCWWGPEIVPWCDLVTFHAHCTGSLPEKLNRIKLVLRKTTAAMCQQPQQQRGASRTRGSRRLTAPSSALLLR